MLTLLIFVEPAKKYMKIFVYFLKVKAICLLAKVIKEVISKFNKQKRSEAEMKIRLIKLIRLI